MSLPTATYLQIDDHMLDDLLAALRRRDREECQRLLARWADDGSLVEMKVYWDFVPYLNDKLTGWVHREISRHVAGDLFEYALCLAERYRRPLTRADMIERRTDRYGALL